MYETIEDIHVDFTNYYHEHYQEMYYVAKQIVHNHYSAEDVVQEAYIKAYRNYNHLIEKSKCRAWLRTIVIRTAIDYYRKQNRYDILSVEEGTEIGQVLHCPNSSVQEKIYWQLEFEKVLAKIETLPKSMQSVLKIKMVTDENDQYIADQLDISLSAVKTRLHRARKLLKTEIETINR
ncbi:RNA polymerase sigma factor [Amphibacillus xylanus]|uniref:RNA polymerase sigma factor n=1 Tax=Amphibacillus xylanus (strain ATCC 51415 / DSM 6626 / JCM 7361 / LMG 17667 / NBRC 15112 / Ep01) TaxID=698758 RepID=K0IW40_AMPXN|nr:RNA polymerase sigma factor [Amphibacillus xylanus]BAM46650.1 putative RNA polymerase ECF-type sigma factor [Amphibacillus xylanus NBRC 15112]